MLFRIWEQDIKFHTFLLFTNVVVIPMIDLETVGKMV